MENKDKPVEAVEFAEWLSKNNYRPSGNGSWFSILGTKVNAYYTSKELYDKYKNSHE